MRVLMVEDGREYTETWSRFLPDFEFERAGSGPEALQCLKTPGHALVVLDMRFDRVPDSALLGDWDAAVHRCNGDPVRARTFLQDHQGNYVLAALREAGCTLPVVLSYDFSEEPRRWRALEQRFAPVTYLSDAATPGEIRRHLLRVGA